MMKLNRNAAIGASMALLGLQAWIASARAADAGMVAVAQNDVRLQLPGQTKSRRIGAMQSLPENSRLQVGAGGRAVVVLYKDGSRFALPAGSVAIISANGFKTEVGQATALPPLKIQQAKVLRGSRIAFGRSASVSLRPGAKHIQLKNLIIGATLETRPTFEWTAVPGAVSYQVQLLADNDKVVFQREATENKLAFPAEVADLKPDVDYLWSVSTVVGPDEYSDQGTFNLVSAQELADVQDELKPLGTDATVDADDQTMNDALRAEIYRKHDLFDESVAIYEQILAKNPDSAAVHAALAEILSGQGRLEDSKLHRQKAEQLENAE